MTLRAVDLFAGFGGFSEGAKAAGASVLYAANHWAYAVQAHTLNHPQTEHVCQDLRQADWTRLPRYDVLLAGPACQGHSTAAQPLRWGRTAKKHDADRATAWAVVDCCQVTRPRAVIVENIPQFADWELFGHWLGCLHTLGYHTESRVLLATDYGVPQLRRRLFIVATLKDALPVVKIPTPRRCRKPVGFSHYVEPGGPWRPISACKGHNARARLQRASERFGEALVQHTSDHNGIALSEPIRTITTRDQWCIVRGSDYRPLTLREYARGMGFPDRYVWPQARRSDVIKGFGNAAPPAMVTPLVRAVKRAVERCN